MVRSPFNAKSRQTTAFKQKGSWKCGYHTGVDRVCDTDATLVAISDGTVESVNACGASYGQHLVIRIDGKYSVLYAHLKTAPTVKTGAKVKTGQKLGEMGNTGNSSGAHLHIEVQCGSKWAYASNLVNPNDLIDWNDFGTGAAKADTFVSKTWTNGGTAEKVYQTTAACKAAKKGTEIGVLNPREKATCRAITSGCYLVEYIAAGSYKCGYVAYHGGVR